jgi:alginate O-acetyltransferase complex protein AlgJ
VLIGDSHVTVFSEGSEAMHGAGAGLPDYLALETGFAADVIASHGDGVNQARVNLYQERSINPKYPDYWKQKHLVIWVFAAREFTRAESWSAKIPVAPPAGVR